MSRLRGEDVVVVVPVRDGIAYLAETLDAIVGQTVPAGEVIVVDDGSDDGSGELAAGRHPSIRVITTPGLGPEAARDQALASSDRPLIALCDADDVWMPTKLERQLALVGDVTVPTVVWTGVTEFVSPELSADRYDGRPPETDRLGARIVSSLLATRATFDLLPSLGTLGSWMTWVASLPAEVTVHHVPEVLVRRRLHLHNLSRTHDGFTDNVLAAVRARLRQQRGSL